jgi:hypothetical protein
MSVDVRCSDSGLPARCAEVGPLEFCEVNSISR